MYSLLLMTAMAGGGDTPSFGGRLMGGCHGCHGAVVAYSCYGSSCHGCYGASCNGCHGVGFLGIRAFFHNRAANRAHGCYGSCHGCTGYSCGGCWGSSCHGCWGASCHGCVGSVGGATHYGAVIVMPAVGTARIEQDDKNQSASLIVELPAGAKLYVDGTLVPGDATARRFHTPELARGKSYFYEMKAEVTVAGKPVVESRTVVVRAGDTVVEKFEKLASASATTGETALAAK